jgi:hypothetical protein
MDTATEEFCFLCGPCRNVTRRTVGANELAVGQLPAGKNVSTEAEDIVGIRRQATTGEDTRDRRIRRCCSEFQSV